MIGIINLDSVNCVKDGRIILDNLSFSISKGTFVSIVGANGSGKSVFLKILAGICTYNGYINVNGYYLDKSNIDVIRKNVSVVFDDIDGSIIDDTVYDNLVMELLHMNKDKKYIDKRVEEICSLFGIRDILYRNMNLLSNSERQKVLIASSLISKPDILLLDDCMHQMSNKDRKDIIDILNKIKKKEGLTIIMATHNTEDVMFTDRVMVLDRGKITLDGTPTSIFKRRDILDKCGVSIPFVIDLSLRLVDKGIIKHVYFDVRKLVDAVWK